MTVTPKIRWSLAEAQDVASELVAHLGPVCDRLQVAGSIRRRVEQVGDIELLCVPRISRSWSGGDMLERRLADDLYDRLLQKRLGKGGRTTYGPKNKLLVHVPSSIPVDIFTTDARNWGMAMVVRTGSADFNIQLMIRFRQLGMAGHAYGGVTAVGGQEIDCPDEETVFRLAGWTWIPPEERR